MAMSAPTQTPNEPRIVYPDSDGMPMADNTLQFRWIVTIQGGLDALFRDDKNIFVAGDLLWYPVEGHPEIRTAPDALVAFGRPKGYRGSYQQWLEDNVPPQVVFEVLSPGNRAGELLRKFRFYERYGVEEYYVFDPDNNELTGWHRTGTALEEIPNLANWVSPRLGIRFDLSRDELRILGPKGRPFASYLELAEQCDRAMQEIERERQEKDSARTRAAEADQKAEESARKATAAAQRAERLAAQLRALGIEPEQGETPPG
jgi:Uma2 family endonuclease